jgi:PEP-CTERM motif
MNFKFSLLNGVAAAAFTSCLSLGNAATVILDFDPANACTFAPCTDYQSISPTYGSTAELTVDFAPGASNLAAYWGTGYGSLNGVAFQNNVYASGAGTASTDPLTISFTAAAGFAITGFSFDYATYQGSTLPVVYSLAADGTTISAGTFTQPQINNISIGGFNPANGLVFKFGPDNWTAGIDNISVEVSAVPEPGEWAMMLAGLGVVGAIARRRRSKVLA